MTILILGGVELCADSTEYIEICKRITQANKACVALLNVFKLRNHKQTKLRIYKTIIRPIRTGASKQNIDPDQNIKQ